MDFISFFIHLIRSDEFRRYNLSVVVAAVSCYVYNSLLLFFHKLYNISLFAWIVSSLKRKSLIICFVFSISGLCRIIDVCFMSLWPEQFKVKCSSSLVMLLHSPHSVLSPANRFLSFNRKQFVLALYNVTDDGLLL